MGTTWLAGLPGAAFAEEASGGPGGSLSAEPLAFAAGGGTLVPDLAQEAGALRHVSAEAVQAREVSETAYDGLSPSAAMVVLNESFPALVHGPTDGLPQLPRGESVGKLLGTHAAQLSGGGQAVVESTSPIAVREASGRLAPLDTGLVEEGGAFAPKRSDVAVSLPKSIGEGVSLPGLGITLTPLAGSGSAPAGASAGTLDGDAVFWGGSSMGKDVDALARATSTGVDLSAILRSVESPETLRYKVGLPQDTTLFQAVEGEGPVELVQAGRPIATIPMPSASDAEGMPVGVSMTVSHDVLELKVDAQPGEVRYPVEVDPGFVTEGIRPDGLGRPGNWHFAQAGGYVYHEEDPWHFGGLYFTHEGSFPAQDWGIAGIETKGVSKIYELSVTDEIYSYAKYTYGSVVPLSYVQGWIEIVKPGLEASRVVLAEPSWSEGDKSGTVCAAGGCSPEAGAEGNAAHFEVNTPMSSSEYQKPGEFDPCCGFGGELWEATVSISEPAGTHATVKYSAAHEIDKTVNVSDIHGGFGPNQGAFEFQAYDAGLGVAGIGVELKNPNGAWGTLVSKNYLTEEAACIGVQCQAVQKAAFTYGSFGKLLPEGKDTIRVSAHDPTPESSSAEYGEGEYTLYVDTKAPGGIEV